MTEPGLPNENALADETGLVEDGRGLALVEALAVAWGADARPDGKTAWFEIGV